MNHRAPRFFPGFCSLVLAFAALEIAPIAKAADRAQAEHDPVTVALANKVAQDGESAEFETARLSLLNIPVSGTPASVQGRKISKTLSFDEGDRLQTIWVITTDKRYVIYQRSTSRLMFAISVDEMSTIVGGKMFAKNANRDLSDKDRHEMALDDRSWWTTQLVGTPDRDIPPPPRPSAPPASPE